MQIGRQKEMHVWSVRKIIKDKDKIKLQLSRTVEYGAKPKTKTKKRPLLEMERLFCVWVEDCNHRDIPISIQQQNAYNFVKKSKL